MKSNSSVRKPALAHSNVNSTDNSSVSVGTILRRAQRQLVVSRCVYALLFMLVIAVIAYLYLVGYVDVLIDKFYALLGN